MARGRCLAARLGCVCRRYPCDEHPAKEKWSHHHRSDSHSQSMSHGSGLLDATGLHRPCHGWSRPRTGFSISLLFATGRVFWSAVTLTFPFDAMTYRWHRVSDKRVTKTFRGSPYSPTGGRLSDERVAARRYRTTSIELDEQRGARSVLCELDHQRREESTMSKTVKPIPDGFRTVTPYLTLRDSTPAIDFYKKAFGAQEVMRMPGPEGKGVMHAEIKIGDSMLFMSDEHPKGETQAPESLGGATGSVLLYVPDVD